MKPIMCANVNYGSTILSKALAHEEQRIRLSASTEANRSLSTCTRYIDTTIWLGQGIGSKRISRRL
jgi:hypothetical protein